MDSPARPSFKGFATPHYTQVPDILFDELLSHLSGSELKVLLYIIRRTFGFKKDYDNISLRQMVKGITTRDGQVLDRGTGLNKDTVIQAVKSLEEQGIIRATRRASSGQGDEATTYELVMEGPSDGGVGKSDTGGCRKIRQGGVGKSDTQYTVIQETDTSNNSKAKFEKKNTAQEKPKEYIKDDQSLAGYIILDEWSPPTQATTPEVESTPRSDTRSPSAFTKVAPALKRPRANPPKRTDEVKETIAAFLVDVAGELHDQAPLNSSLTRAYNLFNQANLSLESYLGRLFEARSITKDRRRDGAINSGRGEMGYFFSVLSERLGLSESRGGLV